MVPLVLAAALAAPPPAEVEIVRGGPAGLPAVAGVTAVTAGPGHHFVGYFGICPWDAGGTRLFCLEAGFGDRLVRADDTAGVCLVGADGTTTRVADTRAWNLQQGAMLHWLPTAADRELLFNDRVDGKLVTVVLDVKAGTRRTLDRPVAAVAPDGLTAVGLDYDRLRQIRPVTGYAGGGPAPLVARPADNGLFAIDLRTGRGSLLLSVDRCVRAGDPPPAALAGQPVWVEHPHFNRDGTRLFFILRAVDPTTKRLVSRPMVANRDGGEPKALLPWAVGGASHYDWLDATRLIVTREVRPGEWRHLLVDVTGGEPKEFAADVLTRDGHCSASPDGRWLVTDTYPDADRRQHLFVADLRTGRAARVASFHTPPQYKGDWRCDLHPRWDRASKRVCVDSTHTGVRQVYVVDLRLPTE